MSQKPEITEDMIDAELSGQHATATQRSFSTRTTWAVIGGMVVVGVMIIIAVLIAGSKDSDEANAEQAQNLCEQAVADRMKDPESAQFRDVTVSAEKPATPMDHVNDDGTTDGDVTGVYWTVTGEVNAKNGWGAYAGYSTFECEASQYLNREMSAGYVKVND